MLPDQEIQLVEIILGQGRTAANLAYIHRFCAYDVLVEGREGVASGLDVFALLDGVTEPARGMGSPGVFPLVSKIICYTDASGN